MFVHKTLSCFLQLVIETWNGSDLNGVFLYFAVFILFPNFSLLCTYINERSYCLTDGSSQNVKARFIYLASFSEMICKEIMVPETANPLGVYSTIVALKVYKLVYIYSSISLSVPFRYSFSTSSTLPGVKLGGVL